MPPPKSWSPKKSQPQRPSTAHSPMSYPSPSTPPISPKKSPTSPEDTSPFNFAAPKDNEDMYAFGKAATLSSTTQNGHPPPPPEADIPETPEQKQARAERIKERGNQSFKLKKFGEAVELYTSAIDLRPTEAAYFTNRAASYMALKKYRLALSDCQTAFSMQQNSPQPKTLLRLARCHLALGDISQTKLTISQILSMEPTNAQIPAMQQKIAELESHLTNFKASKDKGEWAMARLALDKCMQNIDAEGSEVPLEYRINRIEVELGRANWDSAGAAANDGMRLHPNSPELIALRGLVMFLTANLPSALQHAMSALRLDSTLEPALALRKRAKDVERSKEEGNASFKLAKYEDALLKYEEALDRIGERADEGKGGLIRATLLSNRATTLVKLNRHDDALLDTNAAIILNPSNYKTLRTRARIHLHTESYTLAVADFKTALELASEPADIQSLKVELNKAEREEKRSKMKDYYKILGIRKDCSEVEIKKAYRRESLIHHPDKGGDEEKFKLVVEAHAVLSDPDRRSRYDNGEEDSDMSSGMHGHGGVDLSELFAQFQGGGFGGFPGARSHGHSHGFGF